MEQTHTAHNTSPFNITTNKPLVAISGLRGGYLQIATSAPITQYGNLPQSLFLASQDWASRLEGLGAYRVYWITLSEVVPHLHIHLYPRWQQDEPKGLPLFEARTQTPQPGWTEGLKTALSNWAEDWQVEVIG